MSRDKYQHPANPERAKAMHGLRSSSAATPHKDRRTKRERSRRAARNASIHRSVSDQ